MKALTTLADRLVSRLVPTVTAQAAPCEITVYRCRNGSRYRCIYDQCERYDLSCVRVGTC